MPLGYHYFLGLTFIFFVFFHLFSLFFFVGICVSQQGLDAPFFSKLYFHSCFVLPTIFQILLLNIFSSVVPLYRYIFQLCWTLIPKKWRPFVWRTESWRAPLRVPPWPFAEEPWLIRSSSKCVNLALNCSTDAVQTLGTLSRSVFFSFP